MNKPLSPRDYETLSAFLDGELSPKDQARMQARIDASPDLQVGLEELRYTRTILRRTPMRRAPRNFTLKPSMVPRRVLSPAFPVLRLASALASVLFVVAFLSDMFLSNGFAGVGTRSAAPAQPPAAQALKQAEPTQVVGFTAPMSTEAPGAALDTTQATAGAEILTGPAIEAVTGTPTATLETATGLGGSPEPTQEPPMTAAGILPTPTGTIVGLGGGPLPDETEQASIAMTNAPPGKGGGEPIGTPVPPIAAAPMLVATETSAEANSERSLNSPTAEAFSAAAPQQPQVESTQSIELQSTPFGEHTLLRILEGILAVIAVGTGFIAIVLRIRANS